MVLHIVCRYVCIIDNSAHIVYIIKDDEKICLVFACLLFIWVVLFDTLNNSLSIYTNTLQCLSQLLPFLDSAHHALNSPAAGDGIYI